MVEVSMAYNAATILSTGTVVNPDWNGSRISFGTGIVVVIEAARCWNVLWFAMFYKEGVPSSARLSDFADYCGRPCASAIIESVRFGRSVIKYLWCRWT